MGIEQGQCLFCILPGGVLLSICQIGVGKVRVRVGGIRISEKIQPEDFNCILDIPSPLIILPDDVHGGFRPQLGLRIFAPGVQ
jgi:hypothetical protein